MGRQQRSLQSKCGVKGVRKAKQQKNSQKKKVLTSHPELTKLTLQVRGFVCVCIYKEEGRGGIKKNRRWASSQLPLRLRGCSHSPTGSACCPELLAAPVRPPAAPLLSRAEPAAKPRRRTGPRLGTAGPQLERNSRLEKYFTVEL